MSALSVLLATPMQSETDSVQQKCYVTYHLSELTDEGNANITLLENRSLIAAAGTTGLRTWEAALHLGQFLSRNSDIVSGKHVLELGAGTGFISILCARYLDVAHVIASDGSDDVINNLPENLFLNHLQDSARVTPMDLKWGHALVGTEEEVWNGGRPVDVVLGADVTYDASVIPALVATLGELYTLHPRLEVYISATQRNEDTFRSFLQVCERRGMAVADMDFGIPPSKEQEGPFYNDQVPIRICRVTPKT